MDGTGFLRHAHIFFLLLFRRDHHHQGIIGVCVWVGLVFRVNSGLGVFVGVLVAFTAC
jgi:hypothetical protein